MSQLPLNQVSRTFRKNPVGTLSLLGAGLGFATMETLRHYGIAATPAWRILQSGFEAGLVGGCADWFAVTALFRPIPTRQFSLPHTNIIVKSRAKLSAGIVDMVQNRWLSAETLAEHLGRLSASRFLLEHLAAPEARAQVAGAARNLLERLAGSLDAPEIAGFLDRALRDQLAGLDLGPTFGRWMETRIQVGDTSALWDFLAASVANSTEKGDFSVPIKNMLKQAVAHYKDQGVWAWIKGKAAELTFDYDQVADSISTTFAQSLRDIQRDPHHPIRAKLDEQLLGFAHKLTAGDREACAALEQFQHRLTEHAELGPFLARILSRLQETLREQLRSPDSHLTLLLDHTLENLMAGLQSEPDTQARLDGWVRRTILDLAQRNHSVIGEMVAGSLAKLTDDALVSQIEEKVGNDLQYIRLNGAVVGALVGMSLALIKLLLA
jgi:uncharacterized membrane-anchored protein YjiN (DUF445 family)